MRLKLKDLGTGFAETKPEELQGEVWEGVLTPPLSGRNRKPRSTGVTMLIDKGLTIPETRESLELNSTAIDFIKLTFGTAVLYPRQVLVEKIELAKTFSVSIYPGGTFFEIALWQGKTAAYFQKLRELGMEWVEISDGTLEIPSQKRDAAIRMARDYGLLVISEVGKKDSARQPDESILAATARRDLDSGADWVIIEGRESGKGIGIFDSEGGVINEKLAALREQLPLEHVIWEAPLKNQQAKLINTFGPNVNLGNIPPSEIMALEALRQGFRSDTWAKCLK